MLLFLSLNFLATPKSIIFNESTFSIWSKILSGLRSLWQIPLLCITWIVLHNFFIICLACVSWKYPILFKWLYRLGCSQYSITKYICSVFSFTYNSLAFIILGWLNSLYILKVSFIPNIISSSPFLVIFTAYIYLLYISWHFFTIAWAPCPIIPFSKIMYLFVNNDIYYTWLIAFSLSKAYYCYAFSCSYY
jgi:hypothetical protein